NPGKSKIQFGTIRVKPINTTNIDDALKEVPLPSDLVPSKTKTLKDGSKLIYTTREKEMRNLLDEIGTVQVLKPISFLPKLKVLSVPKDLEPQTVQDALQATKSRLIRTITRSNEKHLVFEVDTESFQKLVHNR